MKGKLTLSDDRSLNSGTAAAKFSAVNITDRVCLYAINNCNIRYTKRYFRKVMSI